MTTHVSCDLIKIEQPLGGLTPVLVRPRSAAHTCIYLANREEVPAIQWSLIARVPRYLEEDLLVPTSDIRALDVTTQPTREGE